MNNYLCFFSFFFNFSIIKYSIKEINSLKDKIFNLILYKLIKMNFHKNFHKNFKKIKKKV